MARLNRLAEHLEDKLDVSLRDFIKEKAEVEGLYDYQIAKLLNVRSALIGRLRKTYGIKRADYSLRGFERTFEHTYGKGSIEIFKNMIEQPFSTLVDVAKYFGFCKETARRVYKRIYGVPYTELLQKKKAARRRRRETLRQNRVPQITTHQLLHIADRG